MWAFSNFRQVILFKKKEKAMKVSLIVPFRENDQLLQQLLATVAGQSYKNFELILVKNGPEYENDKFIGDKLGDVRYKVVTSKKTSLGGFRNDGAAQSEGEYVGFLDGDDLLSEYYLEELVNGTEKYPDAEVIYGFYTRNIVDIMNEQKHTSEMVSMRGRDLILKLHSFDFKNARLASVSGWGKLYKSEFIRSIPSVEDILFEDRAVAFEHMFSANEIVVVRSENPIYYYRVTSGSIMNTSSDKHGKDILTASEMSVKSVVTDVNLTRIVQHEAVLFALGGQAGQKGISPAIKKKIWKLIKAYMHNNPYFTAKEKLKYMNGVTLAINNVLSKVKKSVKN